MAHGVIGNTTVFGTVILGSSPGGPTFLSLSFLVLSLAYGVIGNTTVFGTVILGSSPGRPTKV